MDLSIFEQAGLTQGEAAELCGVTRVTYIRWLKGGAPSPLAVKQLKTAVALTRVAVKLGLLPTSLPPSRGQQEARKLAIEAAYAEVRRKVAEVKAQRGAS